MIHLPEYDYTSQLLEDVFSYTPEHPPIVVVDWKVYCHDIHKEIHQITGAARGCEKKLRELITAFWAFKLNRGPEMLDFEEFSMIVVDDSKQQLPGFSEASTSGTGYWRHIEAHKLGLKEYKGGRESKPDSFSLVEALGLEYLAKLGVTKLSKPFFEADDLAGEIVRIKRKSHPNSTLAKRLLVLSTVDNDWSGLVSDKHLVVWANTGPWLPRLRSEVEVCDYFFRKEGLKLKEAKECYAFKARYGDVSDNLPPGTPIRLFDLYDPDHEWNFSEEESTTIRRLLEECPVNNRKDHVEISEKFIKRHGIFPPGHPRPSTDEKKDFFIKAQEARVSKSFTALRGLRARKICEKLLSGPKNIVDKCIRIALEIKNSTKRAKLLSEKIAELKVQGGDEEELKRLKKEKKSLIDKKSKYKKQLEELSPT